MNTRILPLEGSRKQPLNRMHLILGIVLVGLGALIAFQVYRLMNQPVVKEDPSGSCVAVYNPADSSWHDCGWEEGRMYFTETVSSRWHAPVQ